MVAWPHACVGCGETDKNKLNDHFYTYSHQKLISSTYTGSSGGYDHYSNTYNITTLPVHTWVCPDCESKARKRFIFGIIIFLINFILSIAITVAIYTVVSESGISVEFEVELAFYLIATFWIMFSLMGFIAWIVTRRFLERHFHKVRKTGNTFKFFFKNEKYLQIFKHSNPGALIKFQSWFP